MYKVMLIDDEATVRNLMKKIISWNDYNMEIVGEAESGIEAINIIDELRPDLCFVDIRMPFMDGIEFSKLALKRYPRLKIVILTAHEEFSYAQECIGIGVVQYRLKPIVRKDIIETLERVRSKLDEERMLYKDDFEVDLAELGSGEKENSSVDQIIEYLQKNYADSDLNLTKVAQIFGFNASYLSRKFKSEVGDSFVDVLCKIRLEQAKKYAQNGEAMYRVAAKVGIPDPNYFSKCFKKYVDTTYSEYSAKYTKVESTKVE